MQMTKSARHDGLWFLVLGSAVFLLFGTAMANTSPVAMGDFRGLYYPARCLIQGCDPYMESEMLRVVRTEGGDRPWDAEHDSHFTRYIYFPSAFCLTIPFALLPWGPAHLLWLALTEVGLVLAAFLMWNLGADRAPLVSGALLGLLLADSELVVVFGNMAALAVTLCVVAVWCFLRNRFIPAGILCLAVSLCVKPQDGGLVWVCFLLAGGVYTRRALQTLLATIALSIPGLLWIWHIAPHWINELHSNIQAFSIPGGLMDPGLAAKGVFGLGLLISLQTVFSFFRDDPYFYNPASYLVCLPLLLIWAVATLRQRLSQAKLPLALAAVSALSMLPVYHRQDDAALLLLAVPACAMLWAEGGRAGRIALLLTTASIVLSGDLPLGILLRVADTREVIAVDLWRRILTILQVFTIPIALLSVSIFYLWIYARRDSMQSLPGKPV